MDKWHNHFVIKSPAPPCFVPHFLFPVHEHEPGTWLFCDGQQACLELPVLSLILYASIYVFPLISMQRVFFLLFGKVIFLSVLDLSLLFLVLLHWSSCCYPGCLLPSSFILGELLLIWQGVVQKSPAGSLWLPWPPGSAPPLCSHSIPSTLTALFSQWHLEFICLVCPLLGKLLEGHNCIFFALCRACVNEQDEWDEWWMNSSLKKKKIISSLGAVSKVD